LGKERLVNIKPKKMGADACDSKVEAFNQEASLPSGLKRAAAAKTNMTVTM